MALAFNGTSQYCSTATALVAGFPVSMAGWVYTPGGVPNGVIVIGVASGATSAATGLYVGSTNRAQAYTTITNGSGSLAQTAVNSVTLSTWVHLCAVFTSATNRDIYLNGSTTLNDTGNVTPTGQNKTYIGATWQSAVTNFMKGNIAFPAIWGAALTAADVLELSAGCAPWKKKSSSLLAYAKFSEGNSPANDAVLPGGWTLTAAPTAFANPRGRAF